MQVINDRQRCGVRIVHAKEGTESFVGLIRVSILKYDEERSLWDVFFHKDIVEEFDANFEILDMYVRTGESYQYKVIYTIREEVGGEPVDTDLEIGMHEILVTFNGVFLGHAGAQYVCVANPQLSHQKNVPVSYVQTFYSKFPKSVHNGSNDYETGSFQGVFTPFDLSGEPTYANNAKYRRLMKSFLADGRPKVLKTFEGNMWIVQIDSGFSEDYQGFIDGTDVKFNWTEIAETPKTDCAVVIA